jgi:hypothetical protein
VDTSTHKGNSSRLKYGSSILVNIEISVSMAGKMLSGLLAVHKPRGMTSNDVVGKIKAEINRGTPQPSWFLSLSNQPWVARGNDGPAHAVSQNLSAGLAGVRLGFEVTAHWLRA